MKTTIRSLCGNTTTVDRYSSAGPDPEIIMRLFGIFCFSIDLTVVDRYRIGLYSGCAVLFGNSSDAAAVYRETAGMIAEYRISVLVVCMGFYGTAVYGDVMGTVQSMTKFALGSGSDIAVLDDDIPGTAYSMTVSAVGIGCDIATDRDITAGAQPASPRHFISFKFVSGIRYNGASVDRNISGTVNSVAVLFTCLGNDSTAVDCNVPGTVYCTGPLIRFRQGIQASAIHNDSTGTVYSMQITVGINAAAVDGEFIRIDPVASRTPYCAASDLSAKNGKLTDIYGITDFFVFRPSIRSCAAGINLQLSCIVTCRLGINI